MHGLDADLGGIISARRYCFATSVPTASQVDFKPLLMFIFNILNISPASL
jgi:hypothetical protein